MAAVNPETWWRVVVAVKELPTRTVEGTVKFARDVAAKFVPVTTLLAWLVWPFWVCLAVSEYDPKGNGFTSFEKAPDEFAVVVPNDVVPLKSSTDAFGFAVPAIARNVFDCEEPFVGDVIVGGRMLTVIFTEFSACKNVLSVAVKLSEYAPTFAVVGVHVNVLDTGEGPVKDSDGDIVAPGGKPETLSVTGKTGEPESGSFPTTVNVIGVFGATEMLRGAAEPFIRHVGATPAAKTGCMTKSTGVWDLTLLFASRSSIINASA